MIVAVWSIERRVTSIIGQPWRTIMRRISSANCGNSVRVNRFRSEGDSIFSSNVKAETFFRKSF